MTMNVPADQFDVVGIDRDVIDYAIRALDQAKRAGLKLVDS